MHFNKITIYIFFAIKLCFLKEKLNKSMFPPTSDTDKMPQIMRLPVLIQTGEH